MARSLDLLHILQLLLDGTAVATTGGIAPECGERSDRAVFASPRGFELDLAHVQGEHISTLQPGFCDSFCSVELLSRGIQQPPPTLDQSTLGTLLQ